ncbi:RnfH family protein [Thiococcus pfennigii]|uniref:RnfH family protein n=1 Tax=Thiococcus pfennigii TaxID=1057 RepID=UPI0019034CAE|nr:RnfH family protein [Thiococcus pfennigii]MBK1731836.1 RnfH family protein [Thiococcus pfennigii]
MTEQRIKVEVAYAKQREQALLEIEAERGITVAQAIERSGILGRFPEIDLAVNKVGIHGKAARLDQPLASGDRVEIYRPLIADPKAARKRRAGEARKESRAASA